MTISDDFKRRLAIWTLAAAALGLAAGIVFGERMVIFRPVGQAYTMILTSVVYPYLISSLIGGLGKLGPSRAWRLFQSSWGVYVCLWVVTLAMVFALGMAIPKAPPAVFIDAGATSHAGSLVERVVPGNIFAALGLNYVPAVVVFAVAFGVAVQTIREKNAFMEVIEVVRLGSLEIWTWAVWLSPIGVFALFADTAGTVNLDTADALIVYMGLYLIGTFTLAFIVVPLALSAVAPTGARELLAELRPAITLAMVTALAVVALPFVQNAAERLLAKSGISSEESKEVIEAQISLSYVFAQLGNYFIALFILTASYHYRAPITLVQELLLAPLSVVSGFGTPTSTVDSVQFLGGWLNMPASVLDLYTGSLTVTRYGQVAAAVAGFAGATIAMPLIYFNVVQWRPARLAAGLALGAAIALGAIITVRSIEDRLFPQPSDAELLARTIDPNLAAAVDAKVIDDTGRKPAPISGPATVEGIRSRGILRVGYSTHEAPFGYFNDAGELVGYDISHAYELARDLHVSLEFVPLDWKTVSDELSRRMFDIVMAGAYATSDRLRDLVLTEPYLTSPISLMVRSEKVDDYLDYLTVAERDGLTLGAVSAPDLDPLLRYLFPKATIRTAATYGELLQETDIDAIIGSLDQAKTWVRTHNGFTTVKPKGMGAPFVFVYLLPPDSQPLAQFVNEWMKLKKTDGFQQAQVDYWIDGEPRIDPDPRWNVLDALLKR